MGQKEIELILMRQLASYLTMPVFVVDAHGTMLFYNEPAEVLLGRRFDEAGEMPIEKWSTVFRPRDEQGVPLAPDEGPLTIAVRRHRPAHRVVRITGLDGVERTLDVMAFPIDGQGGRHLGAAAIFWEVTQRSAHGR
jgi:PAS domain-containing protein